jgi:hypothetical protein
VVWDLADQQRPGNESPALLNLDWKQREAAAQPLSQSVIERIIKRSCPLDTADERLRQVKDERGAHEIDTPPTSPALQRMKALRAIGRELWEHLARGVFTRETQNPKEWPLKRIADLGFLDLHRALSRTQIATVARQTVDLVNLAFPNVARLTPARLAGSVPATQRRKARDRAS